METLTVQRCGRCKQEVSVELFSPSYRGKPGTWCRACFAAYMRGDRNFTQDQRRRCEWCRELFTPSIGHGPDQMFCTRQCKNEERGSQRRAEVLASKPVDRWCVHCGTVMPQSMRKDAYFCSAVCNSAAHQATRQNARRAMLPRPSQLQFRAVIAKRCKMRCGLCDDPVDLGLAWPNPMYGSIDHIRPLARNGTNNPLNLQLAHLVCNLRKRAELSPLP